MLDRFQSKFQLRDRKSEEARRHLFGMQLFVDGRGADWSIGLDRLLHFDHFMNDRTFAAAPAAVSENTAGLVFALNDVERLKLGRKAVGISASAMPVEIDRTKASSWHVVGLGDLRDGFVNVIANIRAGARYVPVRPSLRGIPLSDEAY